MKSFFREIAQRKDFFSLKHSTGWWNNRFVLLFLVSFFLVSFHIVAQPAKISYTASNTALNKVFDDLSKKYRIKFAYDSEVFKKINASFSFRNESFSKITEYLGEKYFLEFRLIEGTWIVIHKNTDQPTRQMPQTPIAVTVAARSQLSGYVTDQVTGEPLNYCSIVFPNNRGSVTNELGFFYFETSSDSVSFYITHLGYQRLDTVISVKATQPCKITLKPFTMIMEEVDIVRKETNTVEMPKYADRVAFNPSQSANMPRLANDDLVNMLTLIPGIGFLPGSTGGLSIRGSNPSENLIILDGIPLLETGHMFGNVSALNAGFIRQAFVSRGGFDAQFGDRASGLIELTGKSGSRSSPMLETSLNLLNGDIMASLPLGRKFSVSGAYRRSYMDYWPNYLFKKLLNESRLSNVTDQTINVLPTVRYQDINLKATLTPTDNQEISLNFIRTDDQQMLDYEAGTNPRLYRNEWFRGKNTGYGLTWSFQTGKWHHQLTSGYSQLYHYQEQESGKEYTQTTQSQSYWEYLKNKYHKTLKFPSPNRNSFTMDTDSNNVREFRVQFSSDVKQGILAHQFGIGYVDNYYYFRLWSDNSEKTIPTDSLERKANQGIGHIFVQQIIQPLKQLNLRWGLRANYDLLTRKLYLQPRGGIEFAPSEAFKIHYQAGLYIQYLSKIPCIDYNKNVDMVWFLPYDTSKGLLKSVHHMAGFQWNRGGFLINAEYYHKTTSGKQWLFAETYKVKWVTHIRYVSYSGEEQNQGLDIFAQFRHSHWNHQAGYSYAIGREKMAGINRNAWFPSLNNHRHQVQLTEMFSMKGWVASVIWNYSSGQPRLLPAATTASLLFERLDYFSQLDASLAKTLLFRHVGLTCGVSLLNVLNRLNIVQVDYLQLASTSNVYNITSNVSSLSFTPVFFLKCRFF
jgi:ferric enterobactin receptor